MERKRRRSGDAHDRSGHSLTAKRPRPTAPSRSLDSTSTSISPGDLLSPLSDEILVRILSFLSVSSLLDTAPVSRRFLRLSCDSQLWRALYYERFVLPRALRIPGFRHGSMREGSKLHYSARRAVWADGGWGRRGGLVDMQSTQQDADSVDWKQQYKLRHNWAKGKCAVEELKVCDSAASGSASTKTLVKVVEGIAVTADALSGLRAWDLRTKGVIAQISLDGTGVDASPSCLAIDEQSSAEKRMDISIGFADGSFGVWRLDTEDKKLTRRYKHEESSNGKLIGIAYHHPYLLTATESVLISLYNFDRRGPRGNVPVPGNYGSEADQGSESETEAGSESATLRESESELDETYKRLRRRTSNNGNKAKDSSGPASLLAPILLTSLKSHTSRAPLALSIRKMATSVVASIAYNFATRQGWSIGIQDLHIRPSRVGSLLPDTITTRLAYTMPVLTKPSYATPPPTPTPRAGSSSRGNSSADQTASSGQDGPTTLCYTHPYLLATLPDNTLILHLCTSDATKLSVSPGIRLWGHTSGISDAEITARGKAVSVSCRGDEIRVWELEGRVSGKSIEVRPNTSRELASEDPCDSEQSQGSAHDQWDDRRNWVGFDDEMVIVLKEAKDGQESLMVYDFT